MTSATLGLKNVLVCFIDIWSPPEADSILVVNDVSGLFLASFAAATIRQASALTPGTRPLYVNVLSLEC